MDIVSYIPSCAEFLGTDDLGFQVFRTSKYLYKYRLNNKSLVYRVPAPYSLKQAGVIRQPKGED